MDTHTTGKDWTGMGNPPSRQPMTSDHAQMVASGLKHPADYEEYKEAWQFLVDSGEVWRMSPWFGKMAAAMIEGNILHVQPYWRIEN